MRFFTAFFDVTGMPMACDERPLRASRLKCEGLISQLKGISDRFTAMLQFFVSPCRKTHALLQLFVNESLREAFLPKISRIAAFFRQNPC
ncbi:MAG: hypothetical protein IJ106_01935 [Parasporobacterium sp.]|nr:hypothetical protein [Parasporobacterium sp.]